MQASQETTLMAACQKGDADIVEALLKSADVNVSQDNGPPNYETPLMIAAENNNLSNREIVKKLVSYHSIDKKSVDRALIYFSAIGDIKEVVFCLEKGASVNADYLQNTALTEAIEHEHTEIVKELLKSPEIDINIPNYRDETPVIVAICKKNITIIELLLAHKVIPCRLEHVSPLYGTPLTAAVFFDLDNIVKKLIGMDSDFDPNKHPGLLNLAIRKQAVSLTKQLINVGARINELGDNYYPQDLPSWLWQETDALHAPFYPNFRDPIFELPVILAIQTKNQAIMELILPKADRSKRNSFNQSVAEFIKQAETDPELSKIFVEIERVDSSKNSISKDQLLFFKKSTERHSKIPEEFLEIFKGALELLNLFDMDINERDRRILITFLKDESYTPEEISAFSEALKLPASLTSSMDVAYCALHPKKWETTSFEKHKTSLLNDMARLSLLTTTASTDATEAYIQSLKVIAKEIISGFFTEDITLTAGEDSIKHQIIENAQKLRNLKAGKPAVEVVTKKGIIDHYLEACYSEYSSDSVSDSESDSPRKIDDEKKDIDASQFSAKKMEPMLDSWKLLDYFSDKWKNIYELIRVSRPHYRVRDESQMFEVVKAILYHEEKKCSWKSLPQDFVSGGAAYYYKRLWEKEGLLNKIISFTHAMEKPALQTLSQSR